MGTMRKFRVHEKERNHSTGGAHSAVVCAGDEHLSNEHRREKDAV